MNNISFIDIHTHSCRIDHGVTAVRNINPEQDCTTLSGGDFFSTGLHPWHIKSPDDNNASLSSIRETTKHYRVIFVGEAGLDKRCTTNFAEQQRVFETQALIAEENRRPLIIHCVRAYNEILALHKKLNPRMIWIFHAYNGSLETTRQLATGNFMFSFGEYLFLPSTKAIEAFRFLPIDRIFFETDDSHQSVAQMYRQGAQLLKISAGELKQAVWQNFTRILNNPQTSTL